VNVLSWLGKMSSLLAVNTKSICMKGLQISPAFNTVTTTKLTNVCMQRRQVSYYTHLHAEITTLVQSNVHFDKSQDFNYLHATNVGEVKSG